MLLVCAASIIYADIALAAIKTDYGAAIRLRQEYWEKIIDLQTLGMPARDFFRLRTSLWGKVDVEDNFGVYLKLTNEAKYYLGSFTPFTASDVGSQKDERFDVDELIIDNLFVDAKKIFGMPVDLRIGRQDFLGQYGEGFLIMDGTPYDGSRTFYFNAVKATWKMTADNSLDLIYISNPIKDEYLPSLTPSRSYLLSGYINDKRQLNISDETGFVAYWKSKLNNNFSVEPYYIYKEEGAFGTTPKLKLNTFGARAVVTAANWKVRAEYAHQFGDYDNDRDRTGNGGYIFAGQSFANAFMKPQWEIGYVYLSGDDPSTTKHEGWDPLFSRCPSWNEIYIYTMILESIRDGGAVPGYWTNLHLYKAAVKMTLTPTTGLSLSYQYLKADQATSGLSAAMFSNSSKERGHIGTLMLTHAFAKTIDGFLQLEYFSPGDFYKSNAQNAVFARWQLQFKF